jgi:hypothetical protein
MHARFADHTLALFDRHGLTVTGFWTDAQDEGRVFYLLSFPDREAQAAAWAAFQSDPDWRNAKTKSEEDGPIVAAMHSTTLTGTPYWPADRKERS